MTTLCNCLPLFGEQIASHRFAIFGHIARLGEEVPAHQALRVHVDLSLGLLPGRDWNVNVNVDLYSA